MLSDLIAQNRTDICELFSEELELSVDDIEHHNSMFDDIDHYVVIFLVNAVNGIPTPNRITIKFYNNQIFYRDPERRYPYRSLHVWDEDFKVRYGRFWGVGDKALYVLDKAHTVDELQHLRWPVRGGSSDGGRTLDKVYYLPYSDIEVSRPEAGLYVEHGVKLSLRAMLEEAYLLGEFSLANKWRNGITTEDAQRIADEALGLA